MLPGIPGIQQNSESRAHPGSCMACPNGRSPGDSRGFLCRYEVSESVESANMAKVLKLSSRMRSRCRLGRRALLAALTIAGYLGILTA
eukprot:1365454-Amorphochlora_amoeboformis.AAC.2